MRDLYPRPPADEEEREAVANGARLRKEPRFTPYCGALSEDGEGFKCTRAPHDDAVHVSTGNGKVLARWPQAPASDHSKASAPIEVRAGAVVRTATGIFAPEPCPFDGGRGEVTTARVEGDPAEQVSFTVQCVSCAAVGPWHGTEEGAREAWRKRAGASDHSGEPAEMVASTLRGVVRSVFRDGGWEVEIEGGALLGHPGPRFLHLRADELRAEVGQRVKLRIEVDNG